MVDRVRIACQAQAVVGEGPVYVDKTLYWTDPVRSLLLSSALSGDIKEQKSEAAIWSLGAGLESEIFGALDSQFVRVAPDSGVVKGPIAKLPPGTRFNDMIIDNSGALWVGVMHKGILAGSGSLFRSSKLEDMPLCVATGLGVPNGLAFSADGTTLFLIDTLARTLLAYPVEGAGLGQPVIVTDFMNIVGKPDGMALADNVFHVAMWGGGCVAHISIDGATLGTTSVPAPHVSSVCGYTDGRLLVTTSRMRLSPAALEEFPQSGSVFEISLDGLL